MSITSDAIALRHAPVQDWKWPGITIEISWRLRMGSGGCWAAVISENRVTDSGRKGKPVLSLTLVHDDIAGLMRDVTDLLSPDGPDFTD